MCFEFISYKNFNIEQNAMKFLAKLLRYSSYNQKQEILSFIDKVCYSTNFYYRRLYVFFFEEALEIFSISFLKENNLVSNFLRFLDDHIINKNICIRKLKKFYFLISNDTSMVANINKKIKQITEQKNLDVETAKSIRDLNQWLIYYQNSKNNFSAQIEQDFIKYDKESEMRKNHSMAEEIIRDKIKKSSIKSVGSLIPMEDVIKFRKTVKILIKD